MTNKRDGISTATMSTPLTEIDSLSHKTPAGLQSTAVLTRRRALFAVLNFSTWGALLVAVGFILARDGLDGLDGVLLVCVAVGTPWTVLGFWNSVTGFILMRSGQPGLAAAAPFLAAGEQGAPITCNTAILMTLRNEDPARALKILRSVKISLDETGDGQRFSFFVLSDTSEPGIAAEEERLVAAWIRELGHSQHVRYRRRSSNSGFKAGNVREFCLASGAKFELMLPLDADSIMSGPAILRMVRIMQAYPKIGILQSLVTGAPSSSAFARMFQYGMRLGMRSYQMGQVWWTADCGQYWGHSALVRIKPFTDHCALPVLPGKPPWGGEILSHDQVEAALMRRAGFEVRVMPVEDGSFEDNPPDVLEFIRRDNRWCQGNLQYLKLLGLPGLRPVSRFQLVWAILMFAGIPAWTAMIGLLPLAVASAQSQPDFPAWTAACLYVAVMTMQFSPKIAGAMDVVMSHGEVERFGGRVRFAGNVALEIVFSLLLGAISAIHTTLFMGRLIFGKSITWSGQHRDVHGVPWKAAASVLWPQTAFGLVVMASLSAISPAVLVWTLPLTIGYVLAIPFAVITASPAVGAFLRRNHVAAIPEDFSGFGKTLAVQPPGEATQ